jgi:hypothetical protein
MLKLIGCADASGLAWPLADDVWRVCRPEDGDSDRDGAGDDGRAKSLACLVRAGQPAPPGYGLYLTTEAETGTLAVSRAPRRAIPGTPGPVLKLGPELAHLSSGDIIHVPAGARRVTVLWKNSARHNALLLTEQCDNYCLMCSQPPKDRDDSWLFDRARKVVSLLVVQRHTVPVLAGLATFIARNLPFVAQVALMGLEMTGLARPNSALVWADPADYQRELAEAVGILVTAGIPARIYNHQLCVLDQRLWPFAVRSISDWKNDYLDICRFCSVRDACGGVFTTSGNRLSQHLRPVP